MSGKSENHIEIEIMKCLMQVVNPHEKHNVVFFFFKVSPCVPDKSLPVIPDKFMPMI